MAVNINISNYEEFLLSAIDGELTGEEMAALDSFLEQYPDIRKEFALLQSVKLSPDTDLKFDAKDTLYRRADVLSADNYERFLLDYVDNELSASDRHTLESLVSQHPHIQQELMLLQAARLTPDLSVTFENKASLYRKERTRIRPLWWWSAAAAVVAGLSFWLIPAQRSASPEQVAVNQPKQAGTSTSSQQSVAPVVPAPQPVAPEAADNDVAVTATNKAVSPGIQTPADQSADVATPSGRNAALAANTPARSATGNATAVKAEQAEQTRKQEEQAVHAADSRAIALTKLPQPASTSGEVVQQLQQKSQQQEKILAENAAAITDQSAAMANAIKINHTTATETASAAPANVKGELVVAVTMNGDSKLLNGVANVARFLSRKKK
ncbi:anti-sigma factor [Chitinophaga rhizophila]|uniref:Uncharacterized protein n=1 Tax=Chitinophaga rhizophila TaxID=2866212 RepID=A0ABS7GF10_9BACT|nr:hypothetical protein [Chitinophaga rhizophila]MBW8686261.1 hypothetical protein [Chitinophaga rhizophila]